MDLLTPSLPFLEAIQRFGFLLRPMQFFSALGTEWFYLFLMPLLYWGANRRLAARLGALLLFSVVVNEIFKAGFALPRPYWLQPALSLSGEKSFGFPSGHTQNAFLIWLFLAFQSKNPRFWLPLALLLASLIAFSRLFLGVHFPLDVLGGALIGLSILGLGKLGERRWMNFWHEMPLVSKIAIAVSITFVLAAIYTLAMYQGTKNYVADYTSPSLDAYRAATSGSVIATRLGALFGLLCGLALASKTRDSTKNEGEFTTAKLDSTTVEAVRFSTRIAPILRLAIGFSGLMLIYLGLGAVLPTGVLPNFARYALVTMWIVYFAPLLFDRLNLRGPQRVVDGPEGLQ